MFCIIAKSTGKVLSNVGEYHNHPVLFSSLSIALAYLSERYTAAGIQLWLVEKI